MSRRGRFRRGSSVLGGFSESQRRLVGAESDRVFSREELVSAWSMYSTTQGATYFYNSVSKKTTWDVPTDFAILDAKERLGVENLKEINYEWWWIEDEVMCFVPARKISDSAWETIDGRSISARETQGFARIEDIDRIGLDTDDMVKMQSINKAAVLQNLRVRAERDEYFTNVGTILVSINPFKWLSHLYSNSRFLEYRRRGIGEPVAPHFFEISDDSYRGLRDEHQSQSIIISGESGSGKTEATKKCLQYIADVAGSNTGLENKLLATNPILESFGNAKTLRNGNSSRFGKWTVVHFDGQGHITGGRIENYLLEKSRVAIQTNGERNFHVFYELVKGAEDDRKVNCRLPKSCNALKYLTGGKCVDVEGIDDKEAFSELQDAFKELDFRDDVVNKIFRLVSGVLWLGNVEFETPVGGSADDACDLKIPASATAVKNVCDLLCFEKEYFLENVMNRIRSLGGQRIKSPLNVQQATDSCAALAKEIYGRLFDWLVRVVNLTLRSSKDENNIANAEVFIGVLDIFGFEIFEKNSFEQLCINFTNEKLQQHFNQHTFKTEQEVYKAEGIDFEPPPFHDNRDVLSLLEERPRGIFVLLDEECVLPRGSDSSFANKIVQFHEGSHSRFTSGPKLKTKDKHAFAIEHYAGTVVYSASGFLEKNKDDLRENLLRLAESSEDSLMATQLFPPNLDEEENEVSIISTAGSGKASSRRHKTQAGFFRKQLELLMEILEATEPHYIRCIKPNSEKSADRFDSRMCLEQLRYSGVFEAIEIRKQGFPFRRQFNHFIQRYRCLVPSSVVENGQSRVELCKDILKSIDEVDLLQTCRIGKTMILYQAPQHVLLESLREKKRSQSAVVVTRLARGHLARQSVRNFNEIKGELILACDSREIARIESAIEDVNDRIHAPFTLAKEVREARELIYRIEQELEICRAIEKMKHRFESGTADVSVLFDEIDEILQDAERLKIRDNYPHLGPVLDDLEARIAKIRDLIEAKKVLIRATEASYKPTLVEAIQKVEVLQQDHPDFCAQELREAKDRLEEVVQEAATVDKLLNCLRQGCPRGKIGHLDSSTLETNRLQEACAEASEASATLTPRGKALLRYCQILIGLREAFKLSNWATMEELLAQMDSLEENGDMEKFKIPEDEVLKYRGEFNCFTIVSELASSVRHGRVKGNPSSLDLSGVEVAHLKADISDASAVESQVEASKGVITAAKELVSLREAVIEDDWDKVGDIMKHPHLFADLAASSESYVGIYVHAAREEIELVTNAFHGFVICQMAENALGSKQVAGDVGNLSVDRDAESPLEDVLEWVKENVGGNCPTSKSKEFVDLVQRMAKIRRKVRGAIRTEGTVADAPEFLEAVSVALKNVVQILPSAAKELMLIEQEFVERDCIESLKKAVRRPGFIKGVVGNLESKQADAEPLQIALSEVISRLEDTGVVNGMQSERGLCVFKAVEELSNLRINVKNDNWEAIEEIFVSAKFLDQDFVHDEALLIQDELNNRTIIAELTKAITSGMPKGKVGALDLSELNIEILASDIEDAKEIGCKTKEARSLLENATIVLALRKAIRKPDWEALANAVEIVQFKHVHDLCKEELNMMENELNNYRIVHALEHALQSGGPSGSLESLRTDTIQIHALDDALALTQKLRPESRKALDLEAATSVIRSARLALSEKRVMQLEPVIEDAERRGFVPAGGVDLDEDFETKPTVHAAQAELVLVQQKYYDEKMCQELSNLLENGRPKGRVGALDLSGINLGVVLEVLSKFEGAEARTSRSKSLLETARLVSEMREALISGPDWDAIEPLVAQGNEMKSFASVAKDEFEMVSDELEHRRVMQLLREAILHHKIEGPVGALDHTNASVEGLDEAIGAVHKLHCKSPESKQLLESAQVLREIRASVLDASDRPSEDQIRWLGTVQVALDKAHSVGLSEIAKEEVKLVQNHVDDIKIIRELTSALSVGAFKRQHHGRLDLRNVEIERLEAALSCAQTLICRTERARKLNVSAKLIFEVRKALVGIGISEAGAILERQLDVSVRGGTPPDNFRGTAAEAHEELQAITDECRESILREELEQSFKFGNISGIPGNVDTSNIEVARLRQVVELAERVTDHMNRSTKDLSSLASVLRSLREAFLHGATQNDEIRFCAACLSQLNSFERIGESLIPRSVQEELQLAQDHIDNHDMIAELRGALVEGGGGTPLEISALSTEDLSNALKSVDARFGGAKSVAAKDLVGGATILFEIRCALQKRKFKGLRPLLAEAIESDELMKIPAVKDEIYNVRSLLMNFETVENLRQALDQGSALVQPSLDVEDPDIRTLVSSEPLRTALKDSQTQVGGDFDTEVLTLFEFCSQLCELREAFIEGDRRMDGKLAQFERFETSKESSLEDEKHSEHHIVYVELIQKIRAEVALFQKRSHDKQLHGDLINAVACGHLSGTVGFVSTAGIDIASLEGAVKAAEGCREISSRTRIALEDGRCLLSMRKSILSDDWENVVMQVARWTSSIGDADATNKRYFAAEVELAFKEGQRRVVVDGLVHALENGCVQGQPGAISTHEVSVGSLSKAIARALEIGVDTEDAKDLLLAGHSVKQLRSGILAEKNEGGGAGHVDCALVREALKICEDEGFENLPAIAKEEVHLVKAELEDQDASRVLSIALKRPIEDAMGDVAAVSTSTVSFQNGQFDGEGIPVSIEDGIEALNRAISKVSEFCCHTNYAKALFRLAHLMRDLRVARLDKKWADASKAIQLIDEIAARVRGEEGSNGISTQQRHGHHWRAAIALVQAEVNSARDAIQNAEIVSRLRQAMSSGQAPGTPGYLRFSHARLDVLDRELAFAVDVGCKSEEAAVLYKTARLLRQLRTATKESDFVTASVVLSEACALGASLGRDARVSKLDAFKRLPIASDEFILIDGEVDNKVSCRNLLSALRAGALQGKVGSAYMDEANDTLHKAMRKADSLSFVADETKVLLHSCEAVLKLRQILKDTKSRPGVDVLHEEEKPVMFELAQKIVKEYASTAPEGFLICSGNGEAVETKDGEVVSTSPVASFRGGMSYLWSHPDCRPELMLLMDEIQHREALHILRRALADGHAKFLGGFVDVSTVKTGTLEAAIANSRHVRAQTDELESLQISAQVILRCRSALQDGSWGDLQILLRDIARIRVHEDAHDEIKLMQREAHLHEIIKKVLVKLQRATTTRDAVALQNALHDAKSLRLDESPDLHVLAKVKKAKQLLERIETVDDRLQTAVKRSDLQSLEDTLEEAERLQYSPRSAPLALDTRNRLHKIFAEAEKALETIDAPAMRRLLDITDHENIKLPRADEMWSLLENSPQQLQRMRLNAAIERGDEDVVVEVTMSIKSRFFEQEEMRDKYRLENFPNLKSPEEFAANTGVIAPGFKAGMLSHSNVPIPSSLAALPSTPANSLALKIFRALLGYMGDRQYSYPISLAQEILQVGLAVPELRDEIFLQIMKQLNENPSGDSQQRGWLLFDVALQTFPPSEDFENFLELWLRRKAVELRASGAVAAPNSKNGNWALVCLSQMHRIIFKGAAVAAPTLDQLQHFLNINPTEIDKTNTHKQINYIH